MFDDQQQSNAPSNLPVGDPSDMFDKVGEDAGTPSGQDAGMAVEAPVMDSALGSGVLQPKMDDAMAEMPKEDPAPAGEMPAAGAGTAESASPSMGMGAGTTMPAASSAAPEVAAEPKDMFSDVDPVAASPGMAPSQDTSNPMSAGMESSSAPTPMASSAMDGGTGTNPPTMGESGVAVHKAATTGPKVAKILLFVVLGGVAIGAIVLIGVPILMMVMNGRTAKTQPDVIYTPDGGVLGDTSTVPAGSDGVLYFDDTPSDQIIDLLPDVPTAIEDTPVIDANAEIDESIIFGESVDTDGDGLTDVREFDLGTDPKNWDTDGDDLSDGDEVIIWKTDPKNPDTDGDSFKDGQEIKGGYNPAGPGKLFELPNN